MTNFFVPPVLRYSTRVSRIAALAAMLLPGSRMSFKPFAFQKRHNAGGIIVGTGAVAGNVIGAVAAAEVDHFDFMTGLAQIVYQYHRFLHGLDIRLDGLAAGAEMNMNRAQIDDAVFAVLGKDPLGTLDIDAELAFPFCRW